MLLFPCEPWTWRSASICGKGQELFSGSRILESSGCTSVETSAQQNQNLRMQVERTRAGSSRQVFALMLLRRLPPIGKPGVTRRREKHKPTGTAATTTINNRTVGAQAINPVRLLPCSHDRLKCRAGLPHRPAPPARLFKRDVRSRIRRSGTAAEGILPAFNEGNQLPFWS